MALGEASGDPRVATVLEHVRLENAHDFPACVALFARPRYEILATHEVYGDGPGVEGFLLGNLRAFPDFHFEARRVVAADDVVFVEGDYTGTHLGPWHGLPATGRRVDFPMAVVFEFDGDDMVCERVYFDVGTPLRQLGVASDPLSLAGRLTAVLTHPLTILRALLRSLRPGHARRGG